MSDLTIPDERVVPPTLRCDAQRNLERILAVAHEVFAERGIDVPMVEIARRAGVGQGTLYRRFPHRSDLLATLIERRIREVIGWADAACQAEDAGQALLDLMARIIAARQTDRLLLKAIEQPGVRNELLGALRGTLLERMGVLLARAQAAGQIRGDLEPQDIPNLIAAVAESVPRAANVEPELWRRYLAIIAAGMGAVDDRSLGSIAVVEQVEPAAVPRSSTESARPS